jgi:hypothetical protein
VADSRTNHAARARLSSSLFARRFRGFPRPLLAAALPCFRDRGDPSEGIRQRPGFRKDETWQQAAGRRGVVRRRRRSLSQQRGRGASVEGRGPRELAPRRREREGRPCSCARRCRCSSRRRRGKLRLRLRVRRRQSILWTDGFDRCARLSIGRRGATLRDATSGRPTE